MVHDETRDVVVIGAGPGGYGAAFMAADLGFNTTLIDPEPNPGGVCLYRGCIPTKALLHACDVLDETRRASTLGITFSEPEVNLDTLRTWKNSVVEKLTKGLGHLCRSRKVVFIRGTARFEDAHALVVKKHDGDDERIRFEHAVIATGAVPTAIGGLSFDSPVVLNSAKALAMEEIPESLLVIGGGYIGLELGTVFGTLGSKVTLVEMMPGLMPGADRDLVDTYRKNAGNVLSRVIVNAHAKVEATDNGVVAWFDGPDTPEGEHRFDKVLLTVGRKPFTDGLGLENSGIQLNDKGFIETDNRQQTSEPSIFAVGDVTGPPLLAHKATHQGRIAAEVIAGKNVVFEPAAIPAVEYTIPEIAYCGLTETRAREENREVKIVTFPWVASGRAATLGRGSGLTKLIVNPDNDRILGAGIVGTNAGELISEAILAVEMGATIDDVSLTIHPHPTLSETLMESAQLYRGNATDYVGKQV